MTAVMRERQEQYIAGSRPVTREMVQQWSVARRFWNNVLAMLGPVL